MKKSEFFQGILFVILAAFLWGIGGGVAGLLLNKGWDPIVIAAFRALIGLLFLIIWFLCRKHTPLTLNKPLVIWSSVAGIGMAGNIGFYFISIAYTNVPIAATLMYTAPIFVLFIAFIFKTETMTTFKLASTFIVMIGIILLTGVYNIHLPNMNVIGIISGLLSGLSYAVFIFAYKYSSGHGNTMTILNVSALVEFFTLFLLANKWQFGMVITVYQDLVWFILLGFLGAGLSVFLYVHGLKKVSPGIASIIAMIEPITASIFGIIVLAQFLTSMQLIGMFMILLTVTSLSYHSIKQEQKVAIKKTQHLPSLFAK
ncbi:EamA family transporter [Bacillus shivajii]|uniref:DMT family transporter n=1 Tax=Bacillus shivajii TaxID=1983719 RepID=UPI001CFA2FB8|nr:EamA family transporter [Bacillus shivajii]UCZ53913.1 EamA family transporter [Bacillus shivajii]